MKNVIGLIGGTGLGEVLQREISGKPEIVETPFGEPSAPIVRGVWEGMEIAFLPRHGPHHTLPPSAVPYRANIYAFKSLGVTRIMASGATGSLREEFRPRDLVIPDQVIDRTVKRAATFFDEPGIAAHVEFSAPFCPRLRQALLTASRSVPNTVHEGGTYVCMEGPAFSTIAESRMHRSWGGDLIGMTCMPEAKLAREAEICYALVALPTDYDSWRSHEPSTDRGTLLAEIQDNLHHAADNSVALIRATLRMLADQPPKTCPCQTALDLAVWTRREHIDAATIKKLGVILARRFNA